MWGLNDRATLSSAEVRSRSIGLPPVVDSRVRFAQKAHSSASVKAVSVSFRNGLPLNRQ
jgi:hypothetical protein